MDGKLMGYAQERFNEATSDIDRAYWQGALDGEAAEQTVVVQSSAQLVKLFNAFDDLGFAHRYSEELGEFDIKIGDRWVLFQVDPKAMREERDSERWTADTYAVAEHYWRQ